MQLDYFANYRALSISPTLADQFEVNLPIIDTKYFDSYNIIDFNITTTFIVALAFITIKLVTY